VPNLHLNNNSHFKEKEKEETVSLYQAHQILMLPKNLVIVCTNNALDKNNKVKIVKQKILNNEIKESNSLKMIFLSVFFFFYKFMYIYMLYI
jgi:hypothetical protein